MLRAAVLGLGNMGQHHARTLSQIDGVSLLAVCDTHEERRRTISSQLKCNAYACVEDLFKKESLDVIALALPTSLHYQFGMAALKQGLHVLIEKPISCTVIEAEALYEEAINVGKKIMVGHIERFNPAVRALRKYIKEGKLGRLITLHSRRESPYPAQIRDADVMLDLAVHDLDVIVDLCGMQPNKLHVNSGRAHLKERDDHAEIMMCFPGQEMTGYVQVSWISPIRIRQLSVMGSLGYAHLDYMAKTVSVFHPDVLEGKALEVESDLPLTLEWQHFLSSIRSDQTPDVSAAEGLFALKMALNEL